MKINFRKISAIAASAVMSVSSIAFAAAGAYPYPFVSGGSSDVAIVYGTGAGASSLDLIQAGNIQTNLQASIGGSTTTTDASVSGEAVELFSGGTKVYINDSLNTVKNVLTKSDLPTVLADESFSGNVDATITQKIEVGSDPKVTFAKQPTSSDDPNLVLTTSTSQTKYIYNATATFNKAVNLSHVDSEGESITLFGQTFTIAAATDTDTLILLKSAEKISLTNEAPTADVTVEGKTYTVELVSASDTAATIRVTDSTGASESKEINEAASKKVNGLTIAVTTADENNLLLSASIVAGSDKVTLEDGNSVTQGEDATVVDGTLVDFGTSGISTENMTAITISVYAPESDMDAIKAGESFTDPVFGTFKLDFAGFNVISAVGEATTARETISFTPNSDDKMDITFADHRGSEATITWAKNTTSAGLQLMADDDGRNISVTEMETIHYQEYAVVGNEDEGYLLKLSNVKNQSDGYGNDRVEFTDAFSGDVYKAVFTSEGSGSVSVGGKSYAVTLNGAHTIASESYTVRLNHPDSTSDMILYPTIETSKGAKIAFYEPIKDFALTTWDGTNSLDGQNIRLPDGDGYTNVAVLEDDIAATGSWWNFTATGGTTRLVNTSELTGLSSGILSIGQLTYNVTSSGASTGGNNDTVDIYLQTVGGANIIQPAIIIFEEKDDNNAYEAIIVELEDGATGDDGIGIDSVEDTWSNANSGWSATRASDSKITDRVDLWGAIMTKDTSDSDQATVSISYPDEQVYAQLYMAEESASITAGQVAGGTSTPLGEVLVKDSEVSSVKAKNLIVVGGSCINSAAATLLGSGACGADFTTKTGVGSGEFLIQSFGGSTISNKIALLVAGYDAADTVNAAKYLTTQTVTTDASTKYKGTSSTSASLVTTQTA
jgi:hypothetical protein